jgi:hypothetical protein
MGGKSSKVKVKESSKGEGKGVENDRHAPPPAYGTDQMSIIPDARNYQFRLAPLESAIAKGLSQALYDKIIVDDLLKGQEDAIRVCLERHGYVVKDVVNNGCKHGYTLLHLADPCQRYLVSLDVVATQKEVCKPTAENQ